MWRYLSERSTIYMLLNVALPSWTMAGIGWWLWGRHVRYFICVYQKGGDILWNGNLIVGRALPTQIRLTAKQTPPLPKISRGVSDSLQSSVAGDGVWRKIQSIFSLDLSSYVKIVDKLQQRYTVEMDDFGIYAVFGKNSPPQRLLRYVQLLFVFVVNSRLVSDEIKVNICINYDLITY